MASAGILEAVVEHEHLGALLDRAPGARDAVGPDPARRDPGQHQRLVADRRRGVDRPVDPERLGAPRPAVAARQEGDAAAVGDQHARQRHRGRRLAGAARHEIADADHRRADRAAWRRIRRAAIAP